MSVAWIIAIVCSSFTVGVLMLAYLPGWAKPSDVLANAFAAVVATVGTGSALIAIGLAAHL